MTEVGCGQSFKPSILCCGERGLNARTNKVFRICRKGGLNRWRRVRTLANCSAMFIALRHTTSSVTFTIPWKSLPILVVCLLYMSLGHSDRPCGSILPDANETV